MNKRILGLGLICAFITSSIGTTTTVYAANKRSVRATTISAICGVPDNTRVSTNTAEGMIGDDVQLLQCLTSSKDKFDPKTGAASYDGLLLSLYDTATTDQVRSYQEKTKLPVTGVVDVATAQSINNLADIIQSMASSNSTVPAKPKAKQSNDVQCPIEIGKRLLHISKSGTQNQFLTIAKPFQPKESLALGWKSCLTSDNKTVAIKFNPITKQSSRSSAATPASARNTTQPTVSVTTPDAGSATINTPKQPGTYEISFEYLKDGSKKELKTGIVFSVSKNVSK